MKTHFPDNVITSLKETIINVFWKKTDVRSLFSRCGVPAELVAEQDWNAYKYHIVSPVIDTLNSTPEGLGPLRCLLSESLAYKDGAHLLWLSDGQKRKREAERCLEHLRLLVRDHDAAVRTKKEEKEARAREQREAQRGAAFRTKLDDLKKRFLGFCADTDAQARGYGLEGLLYDVFSLFELNPRGPFRRVGEQIDGGFTHDGDHFLLEAKWQKAPVILSDLRDLDGAVGSSLDNTLGLFISMNGFSQGGLDGYAQGSRPRIICMDGQDLMIVLEGLIDFSDLLSRKREIAVQKRKIFATANDILGGRE